MEGKGAMLRAEEEAKARLASDLHDDTIQVMVAAQLSLERISAAAQRSDLALVEKAIGPATETLSTAIERTRHLMFELRPQILGEQGLTAAVIVGRRFTPVGSLFVQRAFQQP